MGAEQGLFGLISINNEDQALCGNLIENRTGLLRLMLWSSLDGSYSSRRLKFE